MRTLAALLLALTIATPAAARPQWLIDLAGTRCIGTATQVDRINGFAEMRFRCRGKLRLLAKGRMRLACGQLVDAMRWISAGYDCTYLGSPLLGTGCDAQFNGAFKAEDGNCGVTVVFVRK